MVAERPDVIAGRYRLMNRIGSGGMGHVWQAWDERLSRAVALKQLHSPVGLAEADARIAHERAMREARITARLHHPNAVPVFDVVDHDGAPCLVMQYLPSRSLQAILAERGPLPVREVARIGSELASALAAAHRADIVHRDVKPGNVLVAEDGTARITDFGISHALGDTSLTSTGMVTGTPAYLAPEVARGATANPASDVFSLGATLYAALEGRPPFGTADNAMALLHRVASGAIAPPRDSELTPTLLSMLAGRPEDRPGMQEVSEALADVAAGRPARGLAAAAGAGDRQATRTRVLPVVGHTASAGGRPGHAGRDRAALPPVPSPSAPSRVAADGAGAAVAAVAAVAAERSAPSTAVRRGDGSPPADTAKAGPAPRPGPRPHRGRGSVLLLLVAALAGAGILLWALLPDDIGRAGQASPQGVPSASSPRGEISRPSSSPVTTPTTRPSASAGATQQPSSAANPPTSGPSTPGPTAPAPTTPAPTSQAPGAVTVTGTELARAVRDYYSLLPGNTDAGWARLTDRYRATTAHNRATYEQFWGSVGAVEVRQADGSAPASVVATVRYAFTDGRRFEERTSYTLVQDGGILKIDRSSVLSSRQL